MACRKTRWRSPPPAHQRSRTPGWPPPSRVVGARAEAGFAPGAAAHRDQLVEVLGTQEADDVEVVARVMRAANLVANAVDALSARLRGQVPAGSRLRDDLVLGALAMVALVTVTPFFALAWRRSPIAVLREMLSLAQTDEESLSDAAP